MNENTDEPKSEAVVELEWKIHLEWAHRRGIAAWARSILGNSAMLTDIGIDEESLENLRLLSSETQPC